MASQVIVNKPFVLRTVTGFRNLDPETPIIIYDYRNIRFYDSTHLYRPVKEFNLPAGTYRLWMGDVIPMDKPVKYKLLKLPRPERRRPFPGDFKVLFTDNPNKCTINWNTKTITFDNQFKTSPLNIVDFILFHEFGHSIYKTEKYCDMYAVNAMIKQGYNPSQIGIAPIMALSEGQFHRSENIVNHIHQLKP